MLTWKTASETANEGFHVERSLDGGASFEETAFVEGAGTTSQTRSYHYADARVPLAAAGRLLYRLRQVDRDGTTTRSAAVEVALSQPSALTLQGPTPNPFRERTRIRYAVPRRTRVRLTVYDALGRQVRVLADREQKGRQEVVFEARGLASGTYFLRLEGGGRALSESMVLVR